MESIDTVELEAVLSGIPRANMLSISAVTDPDMRSRHNPFCTQDGRRWVSHVRKVSFLSGALINVSYNNMVDKRRLQEYAAYRSGCKLISQRNPRAWGVNRDDCPLVAHTVSGEQRLYLHVVVQHRVDHFFDVRTGRKIRGEDFADLLPFLNERDSGYASQKLRCPVVVKDFRLENVAEITANKVRYSIAPAAEELAAYFPRPKPTVTRRARRERSADHEPAAKGAM